MIGWELFDKMSTLFDFPKYFEFTNIGNSSTLPLEPLRLAQSRLDRLSLI